MNEKFFRICKISTTSLMSLVEDILDLAKFEAGTFSLNEQPFSIRSLVQDIEYVFEFQWAQKGIYFNVDVEHSILHEIFSSDVGRIKQILNNLISNAFKFTQQGGITLHISSKSKFDASSFERVRYLEFEVSDTGVGIPSKDIPRLFKMFGMANKHLGKINSNGTGLGLTISKKLVESLGGKISLKSKINIGTDVIRRRRERRRREIGRIGRFIWWLRMSYWIIGLWSWRLLKDSELSLAE